MNPSELTNVVLNILQENTDKMTVENEFHRGMNDLGIAQNRHGVHMSDGTSETANKIHQKLVGMGYQHDTTLGEYNKPVGKTFHVVKVSGKKVSHRFL